MFWPSLMISSFMHYRRLANKTKLSFYSSTGRILCCAKFVCIAAKQTNKPTGVTLRSGKSLSDGRFHRMFNIAL